MSHADNTTRQHDPNIVEHQEKGLLASLKNLQPAAVVVLLLVMGLLVYLVYMFISSYMHG